MWGYFFALRKAARIGQVHLAAGLAAVALSGGLLTQAAVADGLPPGTTIWGGLTWGIGIGTNFDVGGTRVVNASIVNNVVRLSDTSSNVGISFVLESHYFFALPAETTTVFGNFGPPGMCKISNCTEWAWGPFIALEVGDGTNATPTGSGSIAALAMGMMIGLHHPTFDPKTKLQVPDKSSWNFGIGVRVDPAAQVLGPGFAANQAPPAGETAIRFQKEPRAGIMLLSSFSF
jgi:hypothetical protein